MSLPNPLHIRMLAACNLSYKTDTIHSYSPPLSQPDDWQFVMDGPPVIIARNPRAGLPRDLAFICQIPEGILICCRGTQPPTVDSPDAFIASLSDWLNNTEVIAESDKVFPGQCHNGFADSALDLWRRDGTQSGIQAELERLIAGRAGTSVYITGHSKGGALANLLASLISRDDNLTASDNLGTRPANVEVVTFAAARPGDKDFGNKLLQSNIKVTRYEVGADIVPKLPLGRDSPAFLDQLTSRLIDYEPVGALVEDKQSLWTVGKNWAINLLKNGFGGNAENLIPPNVVSAHLITPDSQYDRLVKGLA